MAWFMRREKRKQYEWIADYVFRMAHGDVDYIYEKWPILAGDDNAFNCPERPEKEQIVKFMEDLVDAGELVRDPHHPEKYMYISTRVIKAWRGG